MAIHHSPGALHPGEHPGTELRCIQSTANSFFFAFMHSGELTVPSGTVFGPAKHLTPQDISVDDCQNPSALLKSSKMDHTRQGVDLFVGRTYNPLCPVVAMLRYLAVRGVDNGPLFRFQDGTPLTWSVDKIKTTQNVCNSEVDPVV